MIFESEAEDAELKLIDFGFAMEVRVGREGMWEQLGTPSYMAPELWDKGKTTYDSAVDVWAIGVVAYMLLSGKRPFHHQDMEEKRRLIRHAELQFPQPRLGSRQRWRQGFLPRALEEEAARSAVVGGRGAACLDQVCLQHAPRHRRGA